MPRAKAKPEPLLRDGDELLTRSQLARLLGVRPRTIGDRLRRHALPLPIRAGEREWGRWPKRWVVQRIETGQWPAECRWGDEEGA